VLPNNNKSSPEANDTKRLKPNSTSKWGGGPVGLPWVKGWPREGCSLVCFLDQLRAPFSRRCTRLYVCTSPCCWYCSAL